MKKPAIQTEWDARPVDDNLAELKRMVDRGYRLFESRPWRAKMERSKTFREIHHAQANAGNKMKKGKK